jgi:uncharacterized protein (TIGR02996 family)
MIAAEPFLQTILEQPEADAPRLVFADWLEEQGDPLAELIRIQCELARIDERHPRYSPLQSRERELREHFEPVWLGPIQELGLAGKFRRGLLEISVTGVHTLLQVAERLFALPWVTHVSLKDGTLDRNSIRLLADSPYLERIQELNLERSQLTNEGVAVLCGSSFHGRLTKLNLSHTNISSMGVRWLVEALDLSMLSELRLDFNGIAADGARLLALCAKLGKLRLLDLAHNRIGTVGARYLAESRYLNLLHSLDVRGNNNISLSGKRSLRRRFGPRVHLNNNIDFSF